MIISLQKWGDSISQFHKKHFLCSCCFEIIHPEQPKPMSKICWVHHQGLWPFSSLQYPSIKVREHRWPRLGIPQKIQPLLENAAPVVAFSLGNNESFSEEVRRPGCGVSWRFLAFLSPWEETKPLLQAVVFPRRVSWSPPHQPRGGRAWIERKLVSPSAPTHWALTFQISCLALNLSSITSWLETLDQCLDFSSSVKWE